MPLSKHLHSLVATACFLVLLWFAPVALADQIRIKVEGDFSELEENARLRVGEVEGRTADGLRRYASTAVDQARQAVRALGYYRPDIRWEVSEPEGEPAQLTLTIAPGTPVRIRTRKVVIEGPDGARADFWDALPESPAEGDILHHGRYDALRNAIMARASRLGYFDGEFITRRLEVDPSKQVADITLHYQTGPRYYLGEVRFREGHGFDDELLERFVQFDPHSPYHADKIARLSRDLSNSGYFSGVDVDASPTSARDGVIPVNVNLTPRPPRSISAGVGFSTDVGPRFRGNWREHYINPQGHKRGAETELSQLRQNVAGWYEIPLDPPMTDSWRATAGYQREQIEDVDSQRLTLGQQWNHQLDSGWMQVLSLKWEEERFRIGDDDRETSSLLLPGVSYSKLQADSPIDPSRGFRVQVDVVGAHRAVLSDADILHVNFLTKGLYTLADNHRFLARFDVGGIATNDFEDVPPSLRFFAGGDQSVRGYGYETLSPEDEDGDAIGGRYLMVGSVEYQYEFVEDWRVATFIDRGNAMNNLTDEQATGVGLGVRWVSPLGPLRLDLARGLDEEFGGGWRIHFSMGPEL